MSLRSKLISLCFCLLLATVAGKSIPAGQSQPDEKNAAPAPSGNKGETKSPGLDQEVFFSRQGTASARIALL